MIAAITGVLTAMGGWGYATFEYDAVADTFTPVTEASNPAGARCEVRRCVPQSGGVKELHFHAIRKKMNPNWVLSASGWRKLIKPRRVPDAAKDVGYRVRAQETFPVERSRQREISVIFDPGPSS